MVGFSNAVAGIVNILSAILALVVIGTGIFFYIHQTTACQQFLHAPLLVTGVILFLVSLIGLLGSCARMNVFLYIYLALVFVLVLGLIGVTIFTFIVTNEGAGRAVSGRGYKEYRLGNYSHGCRIILREGRYGTTLGHSRCCKPPTYCEFEFKNATFWMVPVTGQTVPDSDCNTWSNNQKKLCFDCKSCKAGFLANIQREWKTAGHQCMRLLGGKEQQ